jgi:hypothetical protein
MLANTQASMLSASYFKEVLCKENLEPKLDDGDGKWISSIRHLGPLCFIWFVNRILEIFDYVRVLFYADDMKLFLSVSGGFQDYMKIQSDLNKMSEWYERIYCSLTSIYVNTVKKISFVAEFYMNYIEQIT